MPTMDPFLVWLVPRSLLGYQCQFLCFYLFGFPFFVRSSLFAYLYVLLCDSFQHSPVYFLHRVILIVSSIILHFSSQPVTLFSSFDEWSLPLAAALPLSCRATILLFFIYLLSVLSWLIAFPFLLCFLLRFSYNSWTDFARPMFGRLAVAQFLPSSCVSPPFFASLLSIFLWIGQLQ